MEKHLKLLFVKGRVCAFRMFVHLLFACLDRGIRGKAFVANLILEFVSLVSWIYYGSAINSAKNICNLKNFMIFYHKIYV